MDNNWTLDLGCSPQTMFSSLWCIFHGWVRWETFCQWGLAHSGTLVRHSRTFFASKMVHAVLQKQKSRSLTLSIPNFQGLPFYLMATRMDFLKNICQKKQAMPQRSVTIRSRGSKYFWVIWLVRVPLRECESFIECSQFGGSKHLRSILACI